MLSEGDKAPDVTIATPDGGTTTIGAFAGKPLVLYFYPKDDTPGCTTEAQDFSALADDFAAAGAAILGVSKGTAKSKAKFAAKYDLKVGLGADVDDSVCEAYGTWIEKSMYGRNYMGIDRATFLIDKAGTIARIWRKVKVKGHAAEVLEAIKSLK